MVPQCNLKNLGVVAQSMSAIPAPTAAFSNEKYYADSSHWYADVHATITSFCNHNKKPNQ